MGHVHPGQGQRARNFSAARKFHRRQLPIETLRKIALDLEDGLFNEIIIVEKPLRGRGYRLAAGLGRVGRTVGLEEFGGVVAMTGAEIERFQPA